jgi:hypothetical protein
MICFVAWGVWPVMAGHSPHADSALIKVAENIYETDSIRTDSLKKLLLTVPADTSVRALKHFRHDFRSVYANDSSFDYSRESTDGSFWITLWKRFKNLLKKLLGLAPNSPLPRYTDIIIKVLSGLIVLVVIYFGIKLFMKHKGKWFFNNKNDDLSIDINNIEKLIEFADFNRLIQESEKRTDTRTAIRLYYLWLLKHLKDNQIIQWLPDKTNSEYIREIADEGLRKEFGQLSYLYEYVWYGEFLVTDQEYLKAKQAFSNFLEKELKHG